MSKCWCDQCKLISTDLRCTTCNVLNDNNFTRNIKVVVFLSKYAINTPDLINMCRTILNGDYFANEFVARLNLIPTFKNKTEKHDELMHIISCFANPRLFGFDDDSTNTKIELWTRLFYVNNFGWSIPSMSALNQIQKFVKNDIILEVAAGLGFWAYLLRHYGSNVIATSVYADEYHRYAHTETDGNIISWTCIENLNAVDAVLKYNSVANCLMLVWGYSTILTDALDNFTGDKLVIIGEDCGGCTSALAQSNSYGFNLISKITIPRFTIANDYVWLYEKKLNK